MSIYSFVCKSQLFVYALVIPSHLFLPHKPCSFVFSLSTLILMQFLLIGFLITTVLNFLASLQPCIILRSHKILLLPVSQIIYHFSLIYFTYTTIGRKTRVTCKTEKEKENNIIIVITELPVLSFQPSDWMCLF